MNAIAVSLVNNPSLEIPLWLFILGWATALVGWLFLMREAPLWADKRARRIAIVSLIGCTVFAGGAYADAVYAVDGHCTQQNWDTLMGNYGYFEAIIIWYVIAGC